MKKTIMFLLAVMIVITSFTTNVSAADIKLNKSKVKLFVEDSYQLKLKGAPKGAKITWKSSDEKVASVDDSGKVAANKKGKATVTATYKNKKYVCTVTVKKKTAYEIIKKYVLSNYTFKKNSMYMFQKEDMDWSRVSILYDDEEKEICLYYYDNKDTTLVSKFKSDDNETTVLFSFSKTYGYDTFDVSKLKKTSTFDFKWTVDGSPLDPKNSYSKDLADKANASAQFLFFYTIRMADYYLSDMGLSLKDLGFRIKVSDIEDYLNSH